MAGPVKQVVKECLLFSEEGIEFINQDHANFFRFCLDTFEVFWPFFISWHGTLKQLSFVLLFEEFI